MPRLFISHSSVDNIAALAFQRWLITNGWDQEDVFIDLHGIGAGERWRDMACTNAIENMQGKIRRVTRNVKHWRDASMALRWAAAGMLEAKAGFGRLKAYRQLPALRRALAEHHSGRLDMPAK